MELLRFVEAAGMIDATVLLAEDGPLVAALRGAGARVEVIPLSERARGLKRTEVQVGVRQAFAASMSLATSAGFEPESRRSCRMSSAQSP